MISHTRLPRSCLAAVVMTVLGVGLGGCAARSEIDTDPAAQDQRITGEVLRVVGEIEDVVIDDLLVETHAGVVVLSGVQSSLDTVREILRRVARVRGVTEVVNRIRIVRAAPSTEPDLGGLQGDQGKHRDG